MKKKQPQAASQQLRQPASNQKVRQKRSDDSAGDDSSGDAKKGLLMTRRLLLVSIVRLEAGRGKVGSFKNTTGKWSGEILKGKHGIIRGKTTAAYGAPATNASYCHNNTMNHEP